MAKETIERITCDVCGKENAASYKVMAIHDADVSEYGKRSTFSKSSLGDRLKITVLELCDEHLGKLNEKPLRFETRFFQSNRYYFDE